MTPIKVYTVKEHTHYSSSRNHRLVRAAGARGLTNITISRYPAAQPGGGWWLKCDEYEKPLHLGFEVKEAEARINKIYYCPPQYLGNAHTLKIMNHGSTTRK